MQSSFDDPRTPLLGMPAVRFHKVTPESSEEVEPEATSSTPASNEVSTSQGRVFATDLTDFPPFVPVATDNGQPAARSATGRKPGSFVSHRIAAVTEEFSVPYVTIGGASSSTATVSGSRGGLSNVSRQPVAPRYPYATAAPMNADPGDNGDFTSSQLFNSVMPLSPRGGQSPPGGSGSIDRAISRDMDRLLGLGTDRLDNTASRKVSGGGSRPEFCSDRMRSMSMRGLLPGPEDWVGLRDSGSGLLGSNLGNVQEQQPEYAVGTPNLHRVGMFPSGRFGLLCVFCIVE